MYLIITQDNNTQFVAKKKTFARLCTYNFVHFGVIFLCLVLLERSCFGYDCRTLTSPVKLISCLQAIKIHAFDSSEYPVILTFEDHLTPDLQAKVAKVCKPLFDEI